MVGGCVCMECQHIAPSHRNPHATLWPCWAAGPTMLGISLHHKLLSNNVARALKVPLSCQGCSIMLSGRLCWFPLAGSVDRLHGVARDYRGSPVHNRGVNDALYTYNKMYSATLGAPAGSLEKKLPSFQAPSQALMGPLLGRSAFCTENNAKQMPKWPLRARFVAHLMLGLKFAGHSRSHPGYKRGNRHQRGTPSHRTPAIHESG